MTVRVFVPDLPEFDSLVEGAREQGGCRVVDPVDGYWRLEADEELVFGRKALKLGPALWNSALAGGFQGRITEYDRNTLRIELDFTDT